MSSIHNSTLDKYTTMSTVDERVQMYFAWYTVEQLEQLQWFCRLAVILAALITVSNIIVVISSALVIKRGQEPRSAYWFLGNVSLADTLTGISILFGMLLHQSYVTHGVCVIQIGMIVTCTVVSIYSIGLIGMDRYLYILHGLHYHHWVDTKRVRYAILCIWILGLTIGFIPATGWSGDTYNGQKCWYITLVPPELILITAVVNAIPLIIVLVLYSIILYNALKTVKKLNGDNRNSDLRIFRGREDSVSKEISNSSSLNGEIYTIRVSTSSSSSDSSETSSFEIGNRNAVTRFVARLKSLARKKKNNNLKGPTKWRAIKIITFTTGGFVCTWVPYFIATLMYVHCDKSIANNCTNIEVVLISPLTILGFVNSLLNPLIYAWWHPGFRESVRKLFVGFWKQGFRAN